MDRKATSFSDLEQQVVSAWRERWVPKTDGDNDLSPWPSDIFTDRVIARSPNLQDGLTAYPYTRVDDQFIWGDPYLVEKEYIPVAETKSCAVKAISEDDTGAVVGGYLLLWGDTARKDVHGDYFTPETDLWFGTYKSVPLMFHHGLDKNIGVSTIGKRIDVKADEVGVFTKSWIDKHSLYWRLVKPLLDAEVLHYSPGSAAHMIKRADDGKLFSFPVIEDTLTPLPAQHRLLLRPIEQIKAAYKAAGIDMPLTAEETAGAGALGVERRKMALEIEQQLLSLVR